MIGEPMRLAVGSKARLCAIVMLLGGLSVPGSAQFAIPDISEGPSWTAQQGFLYIGDVRELSNGSVILTDLDAPGVFVIDATSREVRKLGRSGAGPLEYTTPTLLASMPGDSTLILDRDARRYLIADPQGRLVTTRQFPGTLVTIAPHLRGADSRGRLIFQATALAESRDGRARLVRWDEGRRSLETIATIRVPDPRPTRLRSGAMMQLIMPFTPQDDWSVAPSGRVVIVRTSPFHIEWIRMDGTIERGPEIKTLPVPVTDADRSAREPRGPPFRLEYPDTKPAFEAGYTIVGGDDVVIVRRYNSLAEGIGQWQFFDRHGKTIGSLQLPMESTIVELTDRFLYVSRTDDNGLKWLDAYAR